MCQYLEINVSMDRAMCFVASERNKVNNSFQSTFIDTRSR